MRSRARRQSGHSGLCEPCCSPPSITSARACVQWGRTGGRVLPGLGAHHAGGAETRRGEKRASVRFCSVPVRDLVRCTWSMRVFWRFQKIKNQKRSNAPPRPGMPMRGATRGRNPRRHRHVPNRGAGPGSGLVGFRRSASARYRTICNNYDDVRRYLHE